MSGIKEESLRWFYRHIHRRGEDAGTLAEAIASGRTHVTEVLNGTKDSPRTRRRLAPLLRPHERKLLGWDRHGNLVESASVPRDPLSAGRHLQEATA